MSWTKFEPRGVPQIPFRLVYVEAPEYAAREVIKLRFGITITEGDQRFNIEQQPNLEQVSGFDRGCSCLYQPSTGKLRWVEIRQMPVGDWEYHEGYGRYEELDQYVRSRDLLFIRASEVDRIL